MFLALGWGCGAALPLQLPPARLSLHHGPPSPSLSLPCCQVFLWAPWMWCWTPAPGWPRTASCTRPRTHRSIGQGRAVGALSHLGRWGGGLTRRGRDSACIPARAVACSESAAALYSDSTGPANIHLRKTAWLSVMKPCALPRAWPWAVFMFC